MNELFDKDLPYKFQPRGAGNVFRTYRHISLACRPGKLLVRAVYKILTSTDKWPVGRNDVLNMGLQDSGWGTLGSEPTENHRCELELPNFEASPVKGETSKSEIEAALRSKEVNCKLDNDVFGNHSPGKWYSDTRYAEYGGCEGLFKPGVTKYIPTTAYIVSNQWRPGLLLAKFEVQEAG
jgi:hypothetical protein